MQSKRVGFLIMVLVTVMATVMTTAQAQRARIVSLPPDNLPQQPQ